MTSKAKAKPEAKAKPAAVEYLGGVSKVKAKPEVKAPVKELDGATLANFSPETLARALAMLKAKGVTKGARRCSGEYLYLRPHNIPEVLRDALQVYMTLHKNATVHNMAEFAICQLLKIEPRAEVLEAMKE